TMMEERGAHDVDLLPASSSSLSTKAIIPQIDLPADVVTIVLTKDEGGFGFNVVGGSDSQHLPGDNGIFVSLVKEDGVAARDGQLKEGDKILSVNGVDLTESSHDAAVKALRECKMFSVATLMVQQNAELIVLAQLAPTASSPFSRPAAPEDPKPKTEKVEKEKAAARESNGTPAANAAALSFGAADTVSIKGSLFGQQKKKDDDEESIYAPSTHSIIDDVPRTPKKKANLYDKVTPLLTEIAYVGIGLAALTASAFVVYKILAARQRQ
ncbi:hypothetical protein PMAYCL1PPCAC_27345, partial [Pristionchus mayeri]